MIKLNFNQLYRAVCFFTFLLLTNTAFCQPDLIVVESAMINSLAAYTLNNDDDCYVQEGCVGGTGLRQILRFTTHIRNVGNQDFYVGAPPSNPAEENEVWEYDNCHGHWHYEGYAEYVLYDQNGNVIPIGFKNGFCLIDVECSGGGNYTYNCGNQGISAGCGDIYGAGLDCQWIDVTGLPDGIYRLMIRVNWDQDPDALGNYESNYDNNTGEVCFDLNTDGNGTASITVLGNGTACNNNTPCHDVTVTINLDNYPAETSWQILNGSGSIVASSNGTYAGETGGSTVSQTVCLPEGCYDFIIDDSYGDGICCAYGNGSYQVTDPSGNVVASGGDFTNSEITNFCIGPPPPCPDADDDGICANEDCDDENAAVPAPPGASCDDGDPNTTNDEIQADGCTCAGSAGDNCDGIHIHTSNNTITVEHISGFPHMNIQIFNSSWTTVASCVDDCGEPFVTTNLPPGTYHVSVKPFDASWQMICQILETVTVQDGPCPDNDNDGVCQGLDCDDNNPNIPTTPGTSCDDGNPNTDNDVIQADGCTCEGVDPSCPDNDNDGICADNDCDDNNPNVPTTPGTSCDDGNPATNNDVILADGCTCAGSSSNGCDAVISTGPGSITVSNLGNPHVSVQIYNASWTTIFSCFDDCDNPQIVDQLEEGTYYVKVTLWNSNWQEICEVNEYVEVMDGCVAGQACDDGDPCTIGETYDINCNCNGGLPATDNDNDGYCAAIDCNDNDPSIPTVPGTLCDDGNGNTVNDVIQADGCTCLGTPIGGGACIATYSTMNNTVIVTGVTATNVSIKLFETNGWGTVFECFNNCTDPTVISNLITGTYYLRIQTWDDSWQEICDISEYVNVGGGSGLEVEEDKEHLFFLASKNERAVHLNWVVTNSEDRTDHFVIERSPDGVNFNGIEEIESLYNRDGIFNYNTNDHQPFFGSNYYRLKLVYYDGSHSYSNVKRVEIATHWEDFSIFPNPASTSIMINMAKYDGLSGQLTLVDQLGQTRKTMALDKITKKPVKLVVDDMPAGLYFVYLKVEGRKAVSKKLMVARLQEVSFYIFGFGLLIKIPASIG